MIRKLLFTILFILLSTSSSFADVDGLLGVDTVDEWLGISTVDEFLGVGVAPGLTPPTYYASAILSMNFEEGLNAFDVSGNAVLFTDSGSDIGAYGHTGQGMKIDDASEDITRTQTARQYFDELADQTICMKVKVTAQLDATINVVRVIDGGSNDTIGMRLSNDVATRNIGDWDTQTGSLQTASGTDLDMNTWEVIAYSWQGTVNPNGDHSTNPGDNATWADAWENDANELDTTMTDSPININIGSISVDPGNTEIVYIDEWALVAGYKFNCSTLFSPE